MFLAHKLNLLLVDVDAVLLGDVLAFFDKYPKVWVGGYCWGTYCFCWLVGFVLLWVVGFVWGFVGCGFCGCNNSPPPPPLSFFRVILPPLGVRV